jgi:hypothetical protein
MPSNPPMALPANEAVIESAPSRIGAYPPAAEPIIIPIIIKLFLDTSTPEGIFRKAQIIAY